MVQFSKKKRYAKRYLEKHAIPEGLARIQKYIQDLKKLEIEWEEHLEKQIKIRDERKRNLIIEKVKHLEEKAARKNKRQEKYKKLRAKGMTYAAIGRKEGVSRQYIEQTIKRRY